MKKTAKKILLSLSVVLLFTVLLCFNASALSKTGNCGPSTDYGKTYSSSVKWSYNKSKKTLTISGKGDMANFGWQNSPFYQANIKKLVIGEGITYIGENAFKDCDRLTSVTLPKSLKTIGRYAFEECDKLKTIKLPGNVTTISEGAFHSCDSLSSVNLPDRVTTLDRWVFGGCKSLKTIKFSKKIKEIGYSAFDSCDSLESVTIPNTVTTIGERAFSGCDNLKTVKIGKKVKTIGANAFYNSSYYNKLQSITVPKTVKKIGDNFVCENTVIESTKGSAAIKWAKNNKRPYVETNGTDKSSIYSGKVGKYKWSLDKRTGVLKLTGSGKLVDFINSDAPWKKHACYIKSLSLSSKMTSIGANAFKGLYRITSVKLPSGVKTLGSSALSDCTSLKTVTLPEKLTSIGGSAFSSCHSLSKINIPDKVTEISDSAFSGCDSLTSITLGRGVETIGYSAFSGCSNLKTVKISTGVKKIGSWAFSGCEKLESINLPNSLSSLYYGVFDNCKKLKSITIPYGVSDIPNSAFTGCEKLKKVVVYNPDCTFNASCGIGYNQTIYGFKKSTAQKYANQVGATFKDVEKIHKHTAGTLKLEQAADCYEKEFWEEDGYYEVTVFEDGSKTKRCTVCNKVLYTEVIPAIKTVKLDKDRIAYTGSAVIFPTVMIYDTKGNALKEGTDYTVSYPENCITIEEYEIVISFKGNYDGSAKCKFYIAPEKVKGLNLTATGNSITAYWNEDPLLGDYSVNIYKGDEFVTTKDVYYDTSVTFYNLDCNTDYRVEVIGYSYDIGIACVERTSAEIRTLTEPDHEREDWDEEEDW